MHYHQFVGQVQHLIRAGEMGEAVRAIRATLQTLGERLFGGEAQNLASQLPEEIGFYLQESPLSEDFGIDEFYRRVSLREGVDLPAAIFHARAVMQVVAQAVSKGLLSNVKAQLPAEYDQLFQGEAPSGQTRAA